MAKLLKYILRRLLIAIPVILGITIINFVLINMVPGNPLDMLIDPNIPAVAQEARREALGLDKPIYVQYVSWLFNLFRGNMGYSIAISRPVVDVIGERIVPTLLLMLSSLTVGLLIALPVGIVSATKQYSVKDHVVTTISFLGISIPSFFLGLALIFIFSVKFHLLPSRGMYTIGAEHNTVLDLLRHLVMPTIVLAVGVAGRIVRYVRSSVLEILHQDYLRTARAKGLRESTVIWIHAFKNALIPIITVVCMEIPGLFGGAVITEQIFSWPGIGSLTVASILNRDYPVLMGLNLLAAFIVLISNLTADILYAVFDPRIQYK